MIAFDAVTVAFGVRNFENLRSGSQRNQSEYLRPGSPLIILEFSQARKASSNTCIHSILSTSYLCGVNCSPEIIQHISTLPESVAAFPEGDDFKAILKAMQIPECKGPSFNVWNMFHLFGRKIAVMSACYCISFLVKAQEHNPLYDEKPVRFGFSISGINAKDEIHSKSVL